MVAGECGRGVGKGQLARARRMACNASCRMYSRLQLSSRTARLFNVSPFPKPSPNLNKTEKNKHQLTSLSHQQKKPDTPREVQHERDGVARAPQQAQHAEEGFGDLAAEPRAARVRDGGVGWGYVGQGGFADEGRGEAPAEPDDQEGEDVVEGGRCGCGWCWGGGGGGGGGHGLGGEVSGCEEVGKVSEMG